MKASDSLREFSMNASSNQTAEIAAPEWESETPKQIPQFERN